MNITDELRELQELYNSGALTDEEFTAAKAAVISDANAAANWAHSQEESDDLEGTGLNNDIAALDREWEAEREKYIVTGRYRNGTVPRTGESLIGGGIMTAFGLLWIWESSSESDPEGFAVVGVVFIVFGLGICISACINAVRYRNAYAEYQQRRAELLDRR